MSATILVLGQTGQMARALAAAPGRGVLTLGRDRLDLSDLDAIAPAIAAAAPAAVINAAAYTAVDKAETDQEAAFRLNRDAPARAAAACARLDIPFLHISTDFVFDGQKGAPYLEDDKTNPLSVYGRSKAAGETAVLAAGARAAIVRSSWLYAADGANFVRTILRLARERGRVRVVADQRGRPTWAADLAGALLMIAQHLMDGDPNAEGVFHFCDSGDASWADLAEAAIEGAARRGAPPASVERITTADYPTPARRPADSRLDCARFIALTGAAPPPWRDSLERCLDEMGI
ncbi:MAG: dTDP-4-dehydrorhamnose reductase [Pseudomonadota bacterium]